MRNHRNNKNPEKYMTMMEIQKKKSTRITQYYTVDLRKLNEILLGNQ